MSANGNASCAVCQGQIGNASLRAEVAQRSSRESSVLSW